MEVDFKERQMHTGSEEEGKGRTQQQQQQQARDPCTSGTSSEVK